MPSPVNGKRLCGCERGVSRGAVARKFPGVQYLSASEPAVEVVVHAHHLIVDQPEVILYSNCSME